MTPAEHAATAHAPVRVLVVDDQTVVREGLVSLLSLLPGIEVVGAPWTGTTPSCRRGQQIRMWC